MTVQRIGTQASQKAPAEHFTGTVRIDPLFQSPPARAGAACVTFEPCSRSDWHTHPLGQTLIVTAGCGLHQRWGSPVEEIHVLWRQSGPLGTWCEASGGPLAIWRSRATHV